MMSLQQVERRGVLTRLFSRVLHTYFRLSRGLTLGVRAIVRSQEDEFLLVRHTYTPGWHFPGGGVEKGETALSALSRELRQETGLVLSGSPVLHGVYFNDRTNKRDHVLVYLCHVGPGRPRKPKGMEIAEIGFFRAESLPQSVDPGTLRRIREITDGTIQGDTWELRTRSGTPIGDRCLTNTETAWHRGFPGLVTIASTFERLICFTQGKAVPRCFESLGRSVAGFTF